MQPVEACSCTRVAPVGTGLRVEYATRPSGEPAYVDLAESADELFVSVFVVRPVGDHLLMWPASKCVDLALLRPLGERAVRDGTAPRDDERRGRRRYLQGARVPLDPALASRDDCQDWLTAPAEPRDGPQQWPGGTVHRRLHPPA